MLTISTVYCTVLYSNVCPTYRTGRRADDLTSVKYSTCTATLRCSTGFSNSVASTKHQHQKALSRSAKNGLTKTREQKTTLVRDNKKRYIHGGSRDTTVVQHDGDGDDDCQGAKGTLLVIARVGNKQFNYIGSPRCVCENNPAARIRFVVFATACLLMDMSGTLLTRHDDSILSTCHSFFFCDHRQCCC